MKGIAASLLIAWVLGTTAVAAAADRVGGFVNAYLKKKRVPGCAVMVRHNGKVVLAAGYGFANLEHSVPVTAQTVFQSGSVGKQFTAMAVMMLSQEETRSRRSDFQISRCSHAWSAITVRHLLTHTSGLGDYPENFSLQRDYTEDELLKMIAMQPLGFVPGEKWSYSNLGYVTLGILIHKVSGEF